MLTLDLLNTRTLYVYLCIAFVLHYDRLYKIISVNILRVLDVGTIHVSCASKVYQLSSLQGKELSQIEGDYVVYPGECEDCVKVAGIVARTIDIQSQRFPRVCANAVTTKELK